MRWFWIDRFTAFESGRTATSIKNVTLAEEHLHDHFAGAPVMPNSLIIEGLAQTGGLLVGEHNGFNERVVLGKVCKAKFHFHAVPGDTLRYQTDIIDVQKDGALVNATSHVGDRLQAEVELFFVHLDISMAGKELFDPATLLQMLKMVGLFKVGRTAAGGPLEIPPALAAAEAAYQS
jgi:3-hydroxyacyl-[acyl-carrier-protein] dehydratase